MNERDPRIEQADEAMVKEHRATARALLEEVVEDRGEGYRGAAITLALMMEREWDFVGAREMYELAMRSPDEDDAADAAINLGCLLLDDLEEVDAAQAVFESVLGARDPDNAVAGLLNLARVAEVRGNLPGALAWYQRTIDSQHPWYTPWAMLGRGEVLEEMGKHEEARTLYQRALESDHPQIRKEAEERLARPVSPQDLDDS